MSRVSGSSDAPTHHNAPLHAVGPTPPDVKPTGRELASSSADASRASAACLQCRRLKSRCRRGPDPTQPCERCKSQGIECEVVKSRRGRVRGSKNKRTGLEKSLAHVQATLDRIRKEAESRDVPGVPPSRKRRRSTDSDESVDYEWALDRIRKDIDLLNAAFGQGSNQRSTTLGSTYGDESGDNDSGDEEAEGFDDVPRKADRRRRLPSADLPLESTRQTPEPYPRGDHDHPLSLLSNVGSTLQVDAPCSPAPRQGDQDNRDDVFPGWTRRQVREAAATRRTYFRHRPGATKRDVAEVLDPISRQFLSVEQAEHLRTVFFTYLITQVGFMDPELHTLANLRARSALLETAVLASAALTQDTPGAKQLSHILYRHAEGLLITVLSRNAKSAEIVQALIILALWPRCTDRLVDDRSRTLLALAFNMALELGMNRVQLDPEGDETAQKWSRDRTRTWIACIIQDRSLSSTSGKPYMLQVDFDQPVWRRWLDNPLSIPGDRMNVAFLDIRSIERNARDRLNTAPHADWNESVRVGAGVLIESWAKTWITPELKAQAPLNSKMMQFIAYHIFLLITVASEARKADIVAAAKTSLEFMRSALGKDARYICRTVSGMITWAGVLLLRLDGDNSLSLVQDVALNLAPYGDKRFEGNYSHFYGSFLLSLCLDRSSAGVSPAVTLSTDAPMASVNAPPADPLLQHSTDLVHGPSAQAGLADATRAAASSLLSNTGTQGLGQSDPLSADQLCLLLGVGGAQSFDFELPWDVQQGATTEGRAPSPPLEWLFRDTSTGGHTHTDFGGDAGMNSLWGFGLGWPNEGL